jgi:hypothetical protein
MNRQRKGSVYLQNGIIFSLKKKEMMSFVASWVELETVFYRYVRHRK